MDIRVQEGTFEIFRTRIRDYIIDSNGATLDKLMLKLTDITYDLGHRYSSIYGLDVLIGIKRPDTSSILKYMYSNGIPEPVPKYRAIGTGSSHGLVFLKKIWHEHMNMEEVGELGYFIIKYIQRFELDLTVGVDNLAGPNNKPQIWFIPDNVDDYQADEHLLKKFEQKTQTRLEKLNQNITDGYNLD